MKTILSAIVIAAAFSAHADYLYWMVDQDSTSSDAVPFTYAKIAVNGTYLTLSGTDGETDVLHSSIDASMTGYDTLATYADLAQHASGNPAALSFVVELYSLADDGAKLVGVSPTIFYDVLKFADYTAMNQSKMPYVFNSFRAVPEPSHALLMFLGDRKSVV